MKYIDSLAIAYNSENSSQEVFHDILPPSIMAYNLRIRTYMLRMQSCPNLLMPSHVDSGHGLVSNCLSKAALQLSTRPN